MLLRVCVCDDTKAAKSVKLRFHRGEEPLISCEFSHLHILCQCNAFR